ncbi:hypothetical protein C1J05_10030 [Sulfitobacter sp. JL08]|nr:hypothetical protein C1J05_10030 [Sulfitobacter sp. JL08]
MLIIDNSIRAPNGRATVVIKGLWSLFSSDLTGFDRGQALKAIENVEAEFMRMVNVRFVGIH